MEKKEFIKFFNSDKDEFIGLIYDKIQFSLRTNKNSSVNEFLAPNLWRKLDCLKNKLGINIAYWSPFEHSEKKFPIFYTEYIYDDFPIDILVLKNKSKFSNLEHRDYLGTLMSLGIKREKLGDLIIMDNLCYVPIINDITMYVMSNLDMVKNSPCEVESYNYSEIEFPKVQFKKLNLITTTMRLDAVVSSITHESRNSSVSLIEKGKVLLDYEDVREKNKLVKENQIITIRGYGKYKIEGTTGVTGRDRIKYTVLQFK